MGVFLRILGIAILAATLTVSIVTDNKFAEIIMLWSYVIVNSTAGLIND